jgi:hypothetical protein
MDKTELKKLQRKWYRILKNKGFDDIEENGNLKDFDSTYFVYKYNKVTFEAKEKYYRLARHMLVNYHFDNILEKRVWELHSHGMTYVEIACLMGVSYDKVERIVHEIRRNIV